VTLWHWRLFSPHITTLGTAAVEPQSPETTRDSHSTSLNTISLNWKATSQSYHIHKHMYATSLSPFWYLPQLWVIQNPTEEIFQHPYFFLGGVRGRPSTPQWTHYSNHTAKYYMMSFPELIFNFLTVLHEKFSNCLGSHFTACADLIAEVNAESAQMKTSGLTEEFLQN